MGEVLETWLRDRLGLIIDLNPDIFGLTTRDGTLLAQLLHSYGIIDSTQLNTIIVTEDPALARVNLKHLRVWLKFIGVDCDDETIEHISNSRGTTAARLFYKIFVSLESKDKLHFITQQKEREKFIPNSSKFDVTTVSDRPPTPESSEDPLAEQLMKNASVIAWHREKFKSILDRCKLARQKCVTIQNRKKSVQKEHIENVDNEKHETLVDRVSSLEKEMHDLEDFTEKHKLRCPDDYTYHELCKEKKFGEQLKPVPVDPEAAKLYVKCMKHRTQRAMATFSCKSQMEKSLTSKLWEKQKQEQEIEFDRAIAKKLFTQSQYEKQMMTKLCEIRDQKRRIARNRGLVETLMQERTKTDHDMELAREHEIVVKEGQDIQAECLRLCELHRRIREEKIRSTQKKHYGICKTVLNDLIDISLKAVHYRENNENFIPTKIWNEWKISFIKSQPIFEVVEHTEEVPDFKDRESTEEIFRAEIERQEILNEADFDDYLNARPPWDEFMPDIDLDSQEILRLGNIVLGYIVHRLLEYICPYESDPQPPPVPKVSSACILLGVLDPAVYPIMQTLLEHRGVKLLHVEDAINYCLLCYKEEMKESAYIDLEIFDSKKEAQPKKTAISKKGETGPLKTPRIITTTKGVADQQTQTPRALPNDDMSPDLSDPAFIGKWAHEYLTLGQPIPNELNTRILIEYLKSLRDIKGWVLVDYPNTFDQMVGLETALTGIKIPLSDRSSDDSDDIMEGMDTTFSGMSYEAENVENGSVLRESRLVCNPIPKNIDNTFKSYMTAYIRAIPKPKNMHAEETDIYEILPEDTTELDSFYADQGLAYAVYYTSFDTPTLKRLCRLAIGDMSIPRVPSEELFGNGLNLLEDGKKQLPPSKAPIIKQFLSRPNSDNIDSGEESDREGEGEGANALNDILGDLDSEPIPPKPGEDGWEWIKFPQAPLLLEALGTLWENMETVYIGDLKEIFFMKRVQYSNILPYRNYVTKYMADFIQRPDIKQDMLHTFHTSYNEIENDMRDDLDVKCELHCRVADFRKELWEICDDRRRQAEDERQRIISQGWTAEEMVVLANLYISMIKAEIDRCVDTVQLLQDYYISMLQRPISATRLPKYPLQRLELNLNDSATSDLSLSPTRSNKPPSKIALSSRSGKNMNNKGPQAVPIIDCSYITKQIIDSLIMPEDEREPLVPIQITCYQAVRSIVTYVQSIIEALASSMFETLNKEQASFIPDGKGRVQIPKVQLLPTANDELMSDVLKRGFDLCQEWRYAVQFEINRARLRLKVLDNAALSDISFLYETMKRCFQNILKDINDRYNREIKSINDMTSVFCSAIEEGIPIQEELLLDGDRFVVRSNVLMYPDDPISTPLPTQEAKLHSQFRMGQLGRLMDVFRYVAPHGSLSERCFTYIIEDMVTCREDEVGMPYLPSSWFELGASEVSDLVSEIFAGSEYIDWREFIIYAMDIPMPSDDDILNARSQFMALDPDLTEMVTRDQFHSVVMWFSNCAPKDPCCENVKRVESRKDEEETNEEEEGYWKHEKMSAFNLGTTVTECKSSYSSKKSLTNSTFSLNSRIMTPQETVRLMLAKELLCEMFALGCNSVNYTAFLLAFSKDYDPKNGFAKALTLALGEKVCASEEEGEKFVTGLLQQKRAAATEETLRNDERETAVKNASSVINDVLKTTLQLTEGITISEVDGPQKCSDNVQSAVVQHDQDIHIVYLDTGSPSNTKTSQPDIVVSSTSRPSESKDSESYEIEQDISTATILAGDYSKESLGVFGESVVVHWISKEVCLSVLVASLPWHARQPDILGTTCCLRECLEKVYLDIHNGDIDEDEDRVLSHRLINHDFITNLLTSTTAFTMKNIGNIVQNLLDKTFNLK